MSHALKEFLKGISLFSELRDEELALLAQVATERTFPRGSEIVREGDPGGSLLIVASGEVKIVLQRASGEPVHLSTFRAGEIFGEMSLFDGRPRSASAVAVVDSRIVEIAAEAFLGAIAKHPRVALKILGEIASRTRRTTETVRELADKVYREAYKSLQDSVAVQLEAIKTIYQRTEERASQTLERASQTVGHVEKLWSLVMRTVPVAGIALSILIFFGVKSWQDVKSKADDVATWHTQAEKATTEIMDARRNLKVMEETALVLPDFRAALSAFRAPIASPEHLRWAAMRYGEEKKQLRERYFFNPTTGPRHTAFQPEVVLEAVDVYVELAASGNRNGGLSPGDAGHLLDALLFVLKSFPDGADRATGRWRQERKTRELFGRVGASADANAKKAAITELKEMMADVRYQENAGLILADLDERDDQVIGVLASILHDQQKSPWRRAAGAAGLERLGDPRGWTYLIQQLDGAGESAYPVAMQLAYYGREGLERRASRWHSPADLEGTTTRIERVIRNHGARNCFEERYANFLVACLKGPCAVVDSGGGLGGDCKGDYLQDD